MIFKRTIDDEFADVEDLLSDLSAAWRLPDASWKKMFATQPPTSQASVVIYHGGSLGGFRALKCSPEQIRMGDILAGLIENDKRARKLGTDKYIDAHCLDHASKLMNKKELEGVAAWGRRVESLCLMTRFMRWYKSQNPRSPNSKTRVLRCCD